MAIELVGKTSASISGFTSGTASVSLTGLTGGLASSPSVGDRVVAFYATYSTSDQTLDIAGYDKIAEAYANDDWDTNLAAFTKYLSAADTSLAVSPTGNVAWAGAVVVFVLRGTDPFNPYSSAGQATGTNTGRPNPANVAAAATGISGSWVLVGGAGAGFTTAFTSSDLSSFTSQTGNDTNDVVLGVGYKAQDTAFDAAEFGGGSTSSSASWAAFSVRISPTFEPDPAGALFPRTTADDGLAFGPSYSTFNSTSFAVGSVGASTNFGGIRFPGVTVDQGATDFTATLRLQSLDSASPGTNYGTWYGDDVDDAPAWSSSSRPDQITPTTASAAVVGDDSDFTVVDVDVTAIVQELVARGGWASGNAMRFGADPTGADGRAVFCDITTYPARRALLIIEEDGDGAPANNLFFGSNF